MGGAMSDKTCGVIEAGPLTALVARGEPDIRLERRGFVEFAVLVLVGDPERCRSHGLPERVSIADDEIASVAYGSVLDGGSRDKRIISYQQSRDRWQKQKGKERAFQNGVNAIKE